MNARTPTEAEAMEGMDTQLAQLRVPPHSIESESSVLGGLLLDNSAWDRVSDILTESDFYRHEHQLIYTAMAQLVNANKPADVITVFEHLQGKADEVGGLSYIHSLAQYVPSAGNIRRYAEIVRERAILRKLVATGDEIATAGFNPQGRPVKQILDDCEQKLLAIGEEGERMTRGFQSMDNLVVQFLDRVQEMADNPKDVTGVPTGFYDLDRMTTGMQPGDLIVIAARPSMGKAQPLDAKVLMANGQWNRMGELSVGDALASVDGAPSVVTGVFPQGRKRVLRVAFSDGRSTECCEEHLWRVSHRKWAKPKVMSTKEISDLMSRPSMRGRLWVDPLSGDFGLKSELPIDPWLLGALLGDGCFTRSTTSFSKTAAETIERVRSALPETVEMVPAGGCDYRLSVPCSGGQTNPLTASIRALGLAGCMSSDKFIPDVYMTASGTDRLNLLRGLLDTDGWVEKSGSVLYSTASQRLALDVQALARSLGYWCSMNTSQANYTYKGERLRGLDQHRLVISGGNLDDLFLFEAKRVRCANRIRSKKIAFASIVPAGEEECQCISVSHPSHLYVTDDYIVTHNTAFAINIAEHVALNEGLPVAVFSMEMGAAQLAIRVIGSIGRIDQSHLRTGQMDGEEWARMTDTVEKVRHANLHIDETGGLTVGELRAAARRLARQCGGKLGLIVVDYLQLMSGGASDENRATELGEITRGLKQLAKELHCPVIALSQLNRSVEARQDKRPQMSDLRESGAIEQDADIIAFIYRDEYYAKEASREPGVAEIIIAKQRNGPTDTVRLAFLKHLTRFESLAPGYRKPDFPMKPAAKVRQYSDEL